MANHCIMHQRFLHGSFPGLLSRSLGLRRPWDRHVHGHARIRHQHLDFFGSGMIILLAPFLPLRIGTAAQLYLNRSACTRVRVRACVRATPYIRVSCPS